MELKILSIPIYFQSLNTVVEQIYDICKKQRFENYCVSATGAHGIVYAQKNKYFKDVLQNFYWNLPDGMPNVWIGKLKGFHEIQRCYGPDVFEAVIKKTANSDIRHYFCGGKEGIAEELKLVCNKNFNNFHICGTFSPPFREMTDEEMYDLANDINKRTTNIVWIGLSTPKQELFANRLAKLTNVHFIIAVGAAFDFYTGHVRQAKKWIQQIGMEWFFRLLMEPKRLWRRYFEIVPKYILLNIIETLKLNELTTNKKQELT